MAQDGTPRLFRLRQDDVADLDWYLNDVCADTGALHAQSYRSAGGADPVLAADLRLQDILWGRPSKLKLLDRLNRTRLAMREEEGGDRRWSYLLAVYGPRRGDDPHGALPREHAPLIRYQPRLRAAARELVIERERKRAMERAYEHGRLGAARPGAHGGYAVHEVAAAVQAVAERTDFPVALDALEAGAVELFWRAITSKDIPLVEEASAWAAQEYALAADAYVRAKRSLSPKRAVARPSVALGRDSMRPSAWE